MASILTQIVYRDEQRKECYPFAEVYFNHGLTMFYENQVISDKVPRGTYKNLSVCSWKLRQKMRWYVGRPREITPELLDSDYEVLSFTRNSEKHDMLAAANVWHPGFITLFDQMLEAIGKKRPFGRLKYPIYQNHFSARADIYKRYVEKWLKPAMEALAGPMREGALSNSRYHKLVNDVDSIYLMMQLGIPHTPMAPFLLERLFSVFVQVEGIKTEWL